MSLRGALSELKVIDASAPTGQTILARRRQSCIAKRGLQTGGIDGIDRDISVIESPDSRIQGA